MAWTSPRTWVDGNLVSHTGTYSLNTELRDNLLWLKTRPIGQDTAASPTTNTGVAAAITGLSTSFTTTGSNVLMTFATSVYYTAANSTVDISFRIDGVSQFAYQFTTVGVGQVSPIGILYVTDTPPSAAAHTFEIYWNGIIGSVLNATPNTCFFSVTELF